MIVKYECEICNENFKTKEEANHCESIHQVIESIDNPSYLPAKQYPHKFTAHFKDGSSYEYKMIPTLKQIINNEWDDE